MKYKSMLISSIALGLSLLNPISSYAREWWVDDDLCKNYGRFCSMEPSSKITSIQIESQIKQPDFTFDASKIPKSLEYLINETKFSTINANNLRQTIIKYSDTICTENLNCLQYLDKKVQQEQKNFKGLELLELILALGDIESKLDINAISIQKAIGAYQMLLSTAKKFGINGLQELSKPKNQIDSAIDYLKLLYSHPNVNSDNLVEAIAGGYHGGEAYLEKGDDGMLKFESSKNPKTKAHSKKVKAAYDILIKAKSQSQKKYKTITRLYGTKTDTITECINNNCKTYNINNPQNRDKINQLKKELKKSENLANNVMKKHYLKQNKNYQTQRR